VNHVILCYVILYYAIIIHSRYGVILKKTGYTEDAMSILIKSVEMQPCLWSSWFELAAMLNDRSDVSKDTSVF